MDVLVTMRPAGEGGARTNTVAAEHRGGRRRASRSSRMRPGKAVNVPVVTLLVTPDQAEALTLAGNEGRIQLVLAATAGDQTMAKTRGSEVGDLYAPNRPVVAPVWRRRPRRRPWRRRRAPVALPPPAEASAGDSWFSGEHGTSRRRQQEVAEPSEACE